MSDYIPYHLLAHVLLGLPFDSLLRSRGVSKSWRALVDSSEFIKMHLHRAQQEANSSNGIKIIALNQNTFYTLDLDLEAHSSSTSASAKQVNCPSDYSGNEVRLIGSCNSLLCLKYPYRREIVLWNPWIQKSWKLPSFPVEYSMYGRAPFLLGFGYDRVNDDYKVLNRISSTSLFDTDQSRWCDEVFVYSLKMNTWRRTERFLFKVSDNDCYCTADCILANGALHWFMKERRSNGVSYIVSFDLSSEEFRKMSCPRYPENYVHQNLRVLNGCLCLVPYYKVDGRYAADLWVMEEYGVDKSWAKLTSVTMPLGSKFRSLTPLALSKNKRRLLLQIDGEKLVLHDLETKCTTDLAIRGNANLFQSSCTCIASLVRPFGTY
ncbi:F-box protein CPR1-like [Coffea eugenioides]|uniref:F-box protein CPR1-like n=1 Tax=Coffea eugenioides TaxID=49369 RepID=UPI000F60820A|nr:F-box protein CPR1-like [Coffea eugenioides]